METIRHLSSYAIPFVFILVLTLGLYRGVNVFDTFVEGAKLGISTAFRIIPPLVGLMVAIGVFRSSGALDLVVHGLRPVTGMLGIPEEVLPLALLRPVSGSASLAMMTDILKEYGADSMIGIIASTMMGSTETTFYTLTVYFGSVGVKDIRYTLAAALIADAVCIICSVWVCMLLFC
jgi:spore maturation protein B